MDSQHSPGTALRANDADYVTWGARWRHRHTAHTTAGGNKGGVAAEWTYGDARGHTQPGESRWPLPPWTISLWRGRCCQGFLWPLTTGHETRGQSGSITARRPPLQPESGLKPCQPRPSVLRVHPNPAGGRLPAPTGSKRGHHQPHGWRFSCLAARARQQGRPSEGWV